MPINRGATPALAAMPTRASGMRPKRFTAEVEASKTAAAPSLIPEALPAVTVPFSRKGEGNAPSFSSDVLRGCSSFATVSTSPFRVGIFMEVISAPCHAAS